jgi:hypothetical protein
VFLQNQANTHKLWSEALPLVCAPANMEQGYHLSQIRLVMSYNPCPANRSECKAPLNDWLRDRKTNENVFPVQLLSIPHTQSAGEVIAGWLWPELGTCFCCPLVNITCCVAPYIIKWWLFKFLDFTNLLSIVQCWIYGRGLKLRSRNFLQQPRPLSVECHIKMHVWVSGQKSLGRSKFRSKLE